MLEIVIFTILISTLLNLVLKRFNIPTIIGYIATGTIIAYGFDLHSAVHNHELKEIAEFGVVFLMFTIGLEFSINHLKSMKKEVFLYGGSQVIITALIFTSIGNYFFNIEIKSAIIIGLALALSSTAIVLKLLNENGDINKIYGRRVLGVLLFQDIAVIPILLMITIFSSTTSSVSSLLIETFIDAVILLAGLYIAGKYLLEPFLLQVSKTKSNEIFISSILLLVMGSSYIAYLFGFSYSLGAFVAGMMIAETHYKHQVEADLIPFRDLLLGVFFITVGMQLDFKIIFENINTIAILLPTIIVIKIAIIFIIMRFSSISRDSFKTAVSLFQLGEFALVIFELSFARDLIDPTLGQILIVTVVISMIMTPFVIKNISQIADIINQDDNKTIELKDIDTKKLKNHIILIGYGRLGKSISELIRLNGGEFIAIEHDIKTVKDAQSKGLPVIYGNASKKDLLKAIGIDDASSVIISLGNSKKLTHICEVVHELAQDKKTIVKVNKYEEKVSLSDLGLSHIIVETEKTANAMYEEAMSI
ncbi:MAG: cation:proton antiporter [Campylobacterota bacterium]|nr:cation:proton antiporter [Campylobacterota bacterium]